MDLIPDICDALKQAGMLQIDQHDDDYDNYDEEEYDDNFIVNSANQYCFFVFRFFCLFLICISLASSTFQVELIEGLWAWSYSWLVARVANIALP